MGRNVKNKENLLISPGHPISSQNCWWADCSKTDISIVATEEAIFTHWHQECDLLGSDKIESGHKVTLWKPPAPENLGSVCVSDQARQILARFWQILPSGILSPVCSPWPSVTCMNIQRVQMWIDVWSYRNL